MRRVAITGLGIYSPIGNDLETVRAALVGKRSGVRSMKSWERYSGLKSMVAGTVEGPAPKAILRKHRRTMGRVALLGAFAARDAVAHAGLEAEEVASERCAAVMGSTTGSVPVLEQFFGAFFESQGMEGHEGTMFMKVMSHTVAANVASMLGIKGRVLAPCSACASSTQAIGHGFELIRAGVQEIAICGGADDLHPTTAGVFDVLRAASRAYNERPHATPRPFDADRDGLVVSEGGAVVVLEDYERARARRARIHAEVLGYGCCCDGGHMTTPSAAGMLRCMKLALDQAGLPAAGLDYINAHATGTLSGDVAEARAYRDLVSDRVPVSGTKGYTGHTLAACGAMELIFCLLMMRHGFLAPTLNLERVDPQCEGLSHLQDPVDARPRRILTSNFAFGGVNASLVLGRE